MFGAIVATVAAAAIKEIPLRTSNMQPVHGAEPAPAGEPAGAVPAGAAAAKSTTNPAPTTD